MRQHPKDRLLHTTAVLARLAAKQEGSPALRQAIQQAAAAATSLPAAIAQVERCGAERAAAVARVSATSAALTTALDLLAIELVAGRLGTRTSPLSAFSPLAPSAIARFAAAHKAEAVAGIAGKALECGVPKVAEAAGAALARASEVRAALDALAGPQALYTRALSERDESARAAGQALKRLGLQVRAEWASEPEVARALLAPPDRLALPRRRQRKRGP